MADKRRNEAIPNVLKGWIRKFSKIEEVFYDSVILMATIMVVSIIYLQSRNLQVQQEIANLNSRTNDMQTDYDNAKQGVNKLIGRNRIEQITENASLTSQQDSIKQVE